MGSSSSEKRDSMGLGSLVDQISTTWKPSILGMTPSYLEAESDFIGHHKLSRLSKCNASI